MFTLLNQQLYANFENDPVKVELEGEEVYALGFDVLTSFTYTIVDEATGATPEQIAEAKKNDQVPDWVRFYNEKQVVLTGYMLPLLIEDGLATKFIMMKDVNTCCFGATPSMNDYAIVTMSGKGAKMIQDVPVQLIGTFKIDQKYDQGYVVSLYLMEGESFLGEK